MPAELALRTGRPAPIQSPDGWIPPPAAGASESDYADVVRAFVGQIRGLAFLEPAPGSAAPDVLFDMEVDGVRCRLLREDNGNEPPASLSPREREIARMVARGYTNKTIAAVLDISLWTVSTHLRRVFAKLGVANRAAMVAVLSGDRQPQR